MPLLRRARSALREALAMRASSGPYRFLVRRWDDVSDVDLALRVLGTEFFREELKLVELPIASITSALVIAPHQDDETIGAGGTLLHAASAGVKLDVLYVTDGASVNPNFHGSGQIRDAEAERVCARLGARVHRLGISNVRPSPTLRDVDRLADIVHSLAPQVIMTPWLLDSPAKHRFVNHLLWLAQRRVGLPPCEVWGYQVHNTLFPNGFVDITGVADQKRQLLCEYKSQNENEGDRRYDHVAMGLAAWNARFFNGSSARYIELFFTLPMVDLLRLVESFYFPDLRATYRGHAAVVSSMKRLHEEVVRSRSLNGSW